jgi:uncharacterized protein (TIGR02147 family)
VILDLADRRSLCNDKSVNLEMSSDVFQYRDYRSYLQDSYTIRKKIEYGFSYRNFAKRVGSAAPNYLKLVADGQRNLSPEMAARFAKALGLGGEAASYFCDLVEFNQAATSHERERCYQRLTRYRRYREAFRLDGAHAEYHSEWYIPAIRELVACDGFVENPKWIARRLKPAISARQAEHALSVLFKLGLVVRNEAGKLEHNEPIVSTGDDHPLGHHVVTYHRTMLERAAEALDLCAREDREIASLTLSVSRQQLAELKQRLYEFRQELLQDALEQSVDAPATDVVQINFQLFPLTELGARDEQP